MRLIDADRLKEEIVEAGQRSTRYRIGEFWELNRGEIWKVIDEQPTVQSERDIPIKPHETTDTAWGIPNRQAVCPKCDYYLGHVVFLGDGKGRKVTYCETCGQAIDWEGWDSDE